ncbi:DNA repair exonuclease [Xanthobacter autotrophicus DSM 431]|uniref:metallophosphoesterase family protein n=1 Tax=Xanthobacter nonsaccharivorans TaxID=3119912 RepID=UPI0037297C9C
MSSSSFSFLHAADLHLDSPLRGLARRGAEAGSREGAFLSQFLGASRRALENLVDTALKEQVAFLLIAGDVYDGDWKDYATGQFFVRQMGRLARAQIPVFIIRGNHDAASTMSRDLPLPANVRVLSDTAVESAELPDLGVVLHGRGFKDRAVTENVARAYPPAVPGRFNIGLLHTSLTGRDGHNTYAPCTVEDLSRAGYDYWALGHIHRREVVSLEPAIVFPGNLQGRHARETGPKGATLVRVADGRIAGLEALTLDAARFEHRLVDLTGCAAMAEAEAAARAAITAAVDAAEGRPLALRLTFTGATALHAGLVARSGLAEEMQAHAYEVSAELLIEKVVLGTSGPDAAPELETPGFEDALAEVGADAEFRAEIAAAFRELRARTPPEVLEAMGLSGLDEEGMADAAIAAAGGEIAARLAMRAQDGEGER